MDPLLPSAKLSATAVYAGDRVKVSAEALDAYVHASTERFASNRGDSR